MRAMRTLGMLKMAFATVVMVVLAGPAGADDALKRVHCERGQSLAKALESARPGDTFLLSGTCQERVTIAIDRVTLDGQGSAVIDGGPGGPAEFSAVVTIKSASGVTIKGLTVRNGPGEGILAQGGASFTLQAAQVHGNAFTGVSVGGNSTAEVIDANIHHNALGADVYTGSSLILKGTIAIMDNSGNGVDINGEAVLEIRGAHVQASDNGRDWHRGRKRPAGHLQSHLLRRELGEREPQRLRRNPRLRLTAHRISAVHHHGRRQLHRAHRREFRRGRREWQRRIRGRE
jgi:Right handed beta helix region